LAMSNSVTLVEVLKKNMWVRKLMMRALGKKSTVLLLNATKDYEDYGYNVEQNLKVGKRNSPKSG